MAEEVPARSKCNWCGRSAPLRQVIEWSNAQGESGRIGWYLCRWHQAAETRTSRRIEAYFKEDDDE